MNAMGLFLIIMWSVTSLGGCQVIADASSFDVGRQPSGSTSQIMGKRSTDGEPAFGKVVSAEHIQVNEPIGFMKEGKPFTENDLLLLTLEVANPHRFLPRTMPAEQFMVDEIQVRTISVPLFQPVMTLVVPVSPGRDWSVLWLLSGETSVERLSAEQVQTLRAQAGEIGRAVFIPLPQFVSVKRLERPTRVFSDLTALRKYVNEAGTGIQSK